MLVVSFFLRSYLHQIGACIAPPPSQDEVRTLGMALGMDEFSVWRHPFPGPGLAIRCLAPLSEENLSMAREVGEKCGERGRRVFLGGAE